MPSGVMVAVPSRGAVAVTTTVARLLVTTLRIVCWVPFSTTVSLAIRSITGDAPAAQIRAAVAEQSSNIVRASLLAIGTPTMVAGPLAVTVFSRSEPPLEDDTCTRAGGASSVVTVAAPADSARPVPAPTPTLVPGPPAAAGP